MNERMNEQASEHAWTSYHPGAQTGIQHTHVDVPQALAAAVGTFHPQSTLGARRDRQRIAHGPLDGICTRTERHWLKTLTVDFC